MLDGLHFLYLLREMPVKRRSCLLSRAKGLGRLLIARGSHPPSRSGTWSRGRTSSHSAINSRCFFLDCGWAMLCWRAASILLSTDSSVVVEGSARQHRLNGAGVFTHKVCRNEPSNCDVSSLDFAGDDLKNVLFAPLQEIAEAPKA